MHMWSKPSGHQLLDIYKSRMYSLMSKRPAERAGKQNQYITRQVNFFFSRDSIQNAKPAIPRPPWCGATRHFRWRGRASTGSGEWTGGSHWAPWSFRPEKRSAGSFGCRVLGFGRLGRSFSYYGTVSKPVIILLSFYPSIILNSNL